MRLSIRAEALKLSRQRAGLFWGFVFIPAFMILLGLMFGGAFLKPPPGAVVSDVHLVRSVARTLSIGGNPMAQLFYAIGAAAIFAVEYRYSGWRHLVPRASRESLMLSKFAAFALFAAFSLLLAAAGTALVMMLVPLVQGLRPATDIAAGAGMFILLSFLVSFAELMALAATVALVAVVTRSTMGAILVPFLLSLVSAAAGAYLGDSVRDLPLPIFAADALRQWIASAPGTPLDRTALIGLATLIAWTAGGLGLAIALFRRQDLVSE
jgi:hypothetical protein